MSFIVPGDIVFIQSSIFMASSLDRLASNWPELHSGHKKRK